MCAEFMGLTVIPAGTKTIGKIHFPEVSEAFLKYDVDWNHIMEVKSKICTLDIVDEFNTSYDSVEKGFSCTVLPTFKNTFNSFRTVVFDDEKQAVVQAIWEFINWYKENKS